MLRLFFALALFSAQPQAAHARPPHHYPLHPPRQVMSHGGGRSAETAWKVANVHEEYEIVHALAVELQSQALVMRKKPYDVLTVRDPRDGSTRALWFDIGSFFPEI